MKVLYLVNGFPSDQKPNHGVFNYRAVKGTSAYIDPIIVKLRYWKPGRNIKSTYSYKGLTITSFSVFYFPTNNSFVKALLLLISLWFAKIRLKKEVENSDLIHSVGLDLSSVIAACLSRKMNKKHIAQCIGTDISFNLPMIEQYPWVKKWSKSTDLVLCNSFFLQALLNKKYPGLPSVVVYRGTNLELFDCEITLPKGKMTFLYLGGFADRTSTTYGRNFKGGLSLLKAWKQVNRSNTLRNGTLLLGGPDSDNTFIKDRLKELAIEDSVICLGQIAPDEVAKWMKKSDVVVLPSHSEGLPNVGVEALAACNILIGSSVGGIPEVIQNHQNGFLFKAGDCEELSQQIATVLNLNEENILIKKNLSRERAEKLFNAKNYAGALFKRYKDILN